MTKVKVYYACMNNGDGSVSLKWFLTSEHAEKCEEEQSEGWGEDCTGSVETFKGSDIYTSAEANSKEFEEENKGKHEFLQKDMYYEARGVGTGARSDKWCEHCGKIIKKGTPHQMHHFYPEFQAFPTHNKCSEAFIKSLR